MNRRAFIQSVGVVLAAISIHRIHILSFVRKWCDARDRRLENYVNQLVDGNIVPVHLWMRSVKKPLENEFKYVANGVCREMYDLQPDSLFYIRYPLHHPWGIPPEPYDLMSEGVVLVERPRRVPLVRREVVKPRRAAKPVKISAQDLLALDNDPDYVYGYGRGIDPIENEWSLMTSEESALREQETF
jgi:hypothetical protein